ncbi:DUF4249 domain-containing protein [Rufibacter roseus]|uniref:DUF4249 domain-containing protein n=1 Tax=Rufibacter roseus TaxID=1567108 RepID=A0ABW2DMP8_9BACT|nr:DUF4249 domain-containing protein [Rufibacter roseus]
MNIKYILQLFCLLGVMVTVTSCDMEQEIEVKLPRLEPQLVVECYLENGKPIRLTLSESSGYFDAIQPTIVDNATVSITKNDEEPILLTYRLEADVKTQKVYTYYSTKVIRSQPGDVYKLLITDPKGRRLTGTTTVLPSIPIDSLGYKFNDKPDESKEAYLLVRWQDDPSTRNFYRLLVHKPDTMQVDNVNSLLDREITDELQNGKKITYFSTYRFKPNDTLTVKLFNAEEAYYRFVSSVEDARRANGNPFAQPVVINNTVAGGFGVFTHLNYSTKEIILK